MLNLNTKHILLTTSLIALTVAFLDRSPSLLSYLSLPAGTVLFGLFLIATALEKESALFDEQNRENVPARKPEQAHTAQAASFARPVLSSR